MRPFLTPRLLPPPRRAKILARESEILRQALQPVSRIDVKGPSKRAIFIDADRRSQLIALLGDPNADTAREAAVALGKSGDTAAVEPLIDVMMNRHAVHSVTVRSAAAKSLGQLADRRAIAALLLAVHDPVPEVGAEAALALGAIGDERAIEPLLNIVRNAGDPVNANVRRAAVRGLGLFRHHKSASALLAIVVDPTEDPAVRHAAKTAARLY
jgi:HEAT repeat protein